MKTLILSLLMLISFAVFSQNIYVLKIAVFDSYSNKPITYKEAILYNETNAVNCSFSDETGELSFVIDSIPINTDSIYFLIKTGDSLSGNTKIYVNNLNLLDSNEIGNYSVKITGFKLFTQKEYVNYCKKNGLIPRRKKTLAKDVK